MPDILAVEMNLTAPARSATSDMPVAEAAEPARREPPRAGAEPASEPPPADTAEDSDAVGRLVRAQAELAQPLPELPALGEQPRRRDFDDPDAYDAALVEWGTGKAIAAVRKGEIEAVSRRRDQEATAAHLNLWAKRVDRASAELPDYKSVAERPDVSISPTMARAIVGSETGPAIAYHLGQNPEEAERIAKLDPQSQVFEIGKLAAEVSREPPAPKPARSARVAASRAPRELSMDEYARQRQPQLHAERRGVFIESRRIK